MHRRVGARDHGRDAPVAAHACANPDGPNLVWGYHAHFPFPDEDFDPNEIAAVVLAHLLVRDVPDLDRRPLMAGVRAWAGTALR